MTDNVEFGDTFVAKTYLVDIVNFGSLFFCYRQDCILQVSSLQESLLEVKPDVIAQTHQDRVQGIKADKKLLFKDLRVNF